MNKLKKSIIIILFVIFIIAVVLIVLLSSKINGEEEYQPTENDIKEVKEILNEDNKVSKISSLSDYFIIKNCMDSYIAYSRDLYYAQDVETKDAKYMNERMLSIIPKFVQDKLNLDNNNLYKTVAAPASLYRIEGIYGSKQALDANFNSDIMAYFINGTFINTDDGNNKKEKFEMIVIVDNINETFCIIPKSYIEAQKVSIKEGENWVIYNEQEIQGNDYNRYQQKVFSNQDMAKEYFNSFRINMQYDPEYIYNNLDKEYSKKRFDTYESFKKYVEKNKSLIEKEQLAKYKVNKYDDYTEYILIDKNENYYIIRETATMQYSLILDTYTLDLPEYVEKYNQSIDRQKVVYCITRFTKAVNDENYKFAYSMLAESFKNNYFKTQQDFENYAKQNFLGRSKLSFFSFKNEGDVYCTYSVTLSNKDDENNKVDKTFVVKLKEGTDFELSFNVN